ncbi:cutinase family protein [Candidatus Saccharibacteria bacterium]|nr:cutinase family protein [Candidatus Saccharibacteria bacterium]
MGRKNLISNLKKIRYFALAVLMLPLGMAREAVQAESCPSLRVVFARGSGGEHNTDANYLEYRRTIEEKLKTTTISYEFIDLDYPAVGVGVDNLSVTIGAYVGAGESYAFGDSVKDGVNKLVRMVNGGACPKTKYVIGGYSQGAMVVSKSLREINADRVIYAATFGDPKLYLPEGAGIMPLACLGMGLSEYRMYVPYCRAHKGLLGAYKPYSPSGFSGKLGTWCNKLDIFCSSGLSIGHHVAYVSDKLYEDASRVIFDKITKSFGVENKVSSPHDTVILIDSTGSMSSTIEKYKAEALKLAEKTFAIGGRIALFDYRDLDDPYEPVPRCDFDECTIEKITEILDSLELDGGGDDPESLLSASYFAMQKLTWRHGATKSLVAITDANFLRPDRDGMTLEEVVKLSKIIDPVNFYIVTEPENREYYEELAEKTDGKVVTSVDELALTADYIIERYDSLPRVNEADEPWDREMIKVSEIQYLSDSKVKLVLSGSYRMAIIAINDTVMGRTSEKEIVITDLDLSRENFVTLTPINKDGRGESVEIGLKIIPKNESPENDTTVIEELPMTPFVIPRSPNTGRAK